MPVAVGELGGNNAGGGTWNGGAEGDRTPDLRNAIATLSQLSYGPIPFREAAH